MMLLCALLLAIGWPWVNDGNGHWPYHMKCYNCWSVNSFYCSEITACPVHLRRCLIVSARLNEREVLVYKNCTNNCTFLYPSEVPAEAPRSKFFRTNSFYFVRCCGTINCNEGGPLDLERDFVPEYTIEERISGTVRLGASTFFLSVASLLVSNTLT